MPIARANCVAAVGAERTAIMLIYALTLLIIAAMAGLLGGLMVVPASASNMLILMFAVAAGVTLILSLARR
ncbi:MAG TPA: hypothetical protein VN667_01725 [Burkholderiales bacterium]|nr:hypothetical protein [Burkholderiales bacterium]